jgi:hypothetical protein
MVMALANGEYHAMVLVVHGRGGRPGAPPLDLVVTAPWTAPIHVPALSATWLARPFAAQVADVRGWLGDAALAVGHSWGAWLLLAAAEERVGRGEALPRLLLLSSVLGMGTHPSGRPLGYIPPRSRRIMAALGIGEVEGGVRLPLERLTFVHGEQDEQMPVATARAVAERGYVVKVVPGGHRLDGKDAREAVEVEVERLRRDCVLGGAW